MLKSLFSGLRDWMQWRARQGRLNVGVTSTYRSIGTVTARSGLYWSIVEDDGRCVYISSQQAADLEIGDRVEIALSAPGMPVLRPYGWIVVRKMAKAE